MRQLTGLNSLQMLQQFDAGRKQAQERNKLAALASAAEQIQQGADMRTVAPELLRSGDAQNFSRLVQLANQDRSFDANQEQRGINNQFRDKSFDATQQQRGIQNNLASQRLNQNASQFDRRLSQNQQQFTARQNQQQSQFDQNLGLRKDLIAEKRAQSQAKANRAPKLTADQSKAVGFRNRTMNAEKILSDPKVVEAMTSFTGRHVANVATPFGLRPFASSKELQKAEQAQRNFINSILRRESGAVISDQEFENARLQYFPQPGEPPEVIEQKAQNRRTAIEALNIASGPLQNQQTPNQQTPQQKVSPEQIQQMSDEDLMKMIGK